MIHKTAIIDPKAKINTNVSIGAYTVIGPNVEVGENSIIQSHVSIIGPVSYTHLRAHETDSYRVGRLLLEKS